jgi:conjugal transfer/type IV secretion protein DotA/TraY
MTGVASQSLDAQSLVSAANTGTASTISAQSRLQQIFGPIAADPLSVLTGGVSGGGTTAATTDVLGTVFSYINMGLLVLGSIYISYKLFSGIVQTAHEGVFAGRAFHSSWIPIRSVTGVFSLIPLFGGWSLLQVLMLWFGIMGAGLGNLAWQAVATNFVPISTLTPSTTMNSSFNASFAPEVFKMNACVQAHNAQINNFTGTGAAGFGQYGSTVVTAPDGSQIQQYGSAGGIYAECGAIKIPSAATVSATTTGATAGTAPGSSGSGGATVNPFSSSSLFGSSALTDMGVTSSTQRATIAKSALTTFNKLNTTLADLSQTLVTSYADRNSNPTGTATLVAYDPVAMMQPGATYHATLVSSISSAVTESGAISSITTAMQNSATSDGFTAAGAWYMLMASESYALNSLAENTGATIYKTADPPLAGDSIWKPVYDVIQTKQIMNSTTAPEIVGGAVEGGGTASDAWNKVVSRINSSDAWPAHGQSVIAYLITDTSGQPFILRLKNLGDNVIGWVLTLMGALTIGKAATGSVVGTAVNWFSGVASAANLWLNFLFVVGEISLGFFLMMSIYIPLIPFIVFMGQILAWLLSVIEGVAAAPFLAFAHFDTDGEGMGQRTAHGYTFMLQSFMRPVMLVFSFLVASKTLDVMGNYLMQIYPIVVANAQMNSMTGFFSVLGYTAIFLTLGVGLVNSCMSIMYILPESLWAFMGASGSQPMQIGRNTQDAANTATAISTGVTMGGKNLSMRSAALAEDGGKKTGGGKGGLTPMQ